MEPHQRKQFVHLHRTCIFGYNRKNDGPSMSVTYYLMSDPDTILISTMAARGKAKAVARNGKVSLCVLDENIEVAIAGKCSGIEQFEFRRRAPAPAILFHEGFVGKFGMRILVEHPHIAVRGSRIEVEVIFFHVFAVIALIPRQAKKPFLQNGVAPVP